MFAQEDSLHIGKPNVFDMIENDVVNAEKLKEGTNFEKWMYGQKRHSLVVYYGAMLQYGVNDKASAMTLNHDLGVFYKGKFIERKNYKLTVEAWVEQNSLLTGKSTKDFSKELGMFSATNGSDATGHTIGLEYLYIENLFFNGKLDITLGKIDPLFLTTFATYSGWDRYTFFSKTAASDPVPPIDPGFGVFTEINFNKYISIGGLVSDDNPQNDIIDPVNFFSNTNYAFSGFVRFALPSSKNLYSYHIVSYYYVQPWDTIEQAKGFTYVGNQGVSKNIILTIKVSNGANRVLKYNAAYAIGAVWLQPFNRPGDQFGFSGQLNEKEGKQEYGIDTYYKLYIKPWITCSANLQVYYASGKKINTIPGFRIMVTY
jgi:hypothetical protein